MKSFSLIVVISALITPLLVSSQSLMNGETFELFDGDVLQSERDEILVDWSINNYDPNSYYWVAIATVNDVDFTIIRDVCERGIVSGNEQAYERDRREWDINLFYLKFPISSSSGSQIIFEKRNWQGCKPFIILLIETSNQNKNQFFQRWMSGDSGFPGISPARLSGDEVEEYSIIYGKR